MNCLVCYYSFVFVIKNLDANQFIRCIGVPQTFGICTQNENQRPMILDQRQFPLDAYNYTCPTCRLFSIDRVKSLPSLRVSNLMIDDCSPRKPYPQGEAPIERLPYEVLEVIVSYLTLDIPPDGYTPRNEDLMSVLLTCRTLFFATLNVLYRIVTIPHSGIFTKALRQLRSAPKLAALVRRLDFSHFTSVGLGRSGQMLAGIQNLTEDTLLECLNLLPSLRELLLQEHLENDISEAVVRKIFSGGNLQAVDFCGCSSSQFSDVFARAVFSSGQPLPELRRLSLHECSALEPRVFGQLLRRLPHLTHLDVAHTLISIDALFAIPPTARLTHLNLGRCMQLAGSDVVEFLTNHPATCNDSLVYLNLMVDTSRHFMLDDSNISTLLSRLGPSLRSLNINGSGVRSFHIPELARLARHLEELGLASTTVTSVDVNRIFSLEFGRPTLRYIDLSNTYLTLADLSSTRLCVLVSPASAPLSAIELDEKLMKPLRLQQEGFAIRHESVKMHQYAPSRSLTTTDSVFQNPTVRNLLGRRFPLAGPPASRPWPDDPLSDVELCSRYGNGWVVRELGRRGWYVRGPGAEGADLCVSGERPLGPSHSDAGDAEVDDGRRWWKMGARWWGMRKVPVAVGEVGGLYGHYMFKR